MRCALCGGELKKKEVIEEIRQENDHIMVKVKAEVCEQCHERYYASGVVDKLIDLKERFRGHRSALHSIGKVYEMSTELRRRFT